MPFILELCACPQKINADADRAMLAYYFRRQEEHKVVYKPVHTASALLHLCMPSLCAITFLLHSWLNTLAPDSSNQRADSIRRLWRLHRSEVVQKVSHGQTLLL